MQGHEWLALIILLIPIVWIGIYPDTFLGKIEPDLKHHIEAIERSAHVMVAGQGKHRMMSNPANRSGGRQ